MNKKLAAKIQKLNPILSQYQEAFSKCVQIEPDVKDIVLKKGNVYAVYSVYSDSEFDTDLINRVVYDVLNNFYYQSTNISPVQSLEAAIVQIRDKVAQLPNDALRSNPQSLKFNILCAVIWGNILYVVQYGEAACSTVKNGEIKQVSMASEGSFSAASGALNENDVVIISTKEFDEVYPPQKLLSSAIAEQDLNPKEACMVMKIIVDTNFSESENIDFGIEASVPKRAVNKAGKKVVGKTKEIAKGALNTLSKINFPRIKKITKNKTDSLSSIRPVEKQPKELKKYILPLLFIALAISVAAGLNNRKSNKTVDTNQNTLGETKTNPEPSEKEPPKGPEAAYDLKLSDENINANDMSFSGDYVVIADQNSGKIYYSKKDAYKFEQAQQTFPGIKSLADYKGDITFVYEKGFVRYNFLDNKIVEQIDKTGLTTGTIYGDLTYVTSGDMLNRYNKNAETLWGQSTDFIDAKSISIAYNIYLVTSQGNIVSYKTGTKTDFSVTGVDKPINNPTKIQTDIDFDNIYICDKGNNRIVAIDKSGKFIKSYKAEPESAWADIVGMTVSEKDKKILLLNGTKLFEINI